MPFNEAVAESGVAVRADIVRGENLSIHTVDGQLPDSRLHCDDVVGRIIKALDTQIQQTEAALAAASRTDAEEVSSGANPTLGNAQSEYIRVQADYAGNKAQTSQIAQQLQMNA